MTIIASVLKEQGVTFAIIAVKPYVLTSSTKEQIRASYAQYFSNVPIILMSKNNRGIPTYDGRRDIVNFLAKINPARIPWKQYKIK